MFSTTFSPFYQLSIQTTHGTHDHRGLVPSQNTLEVRHYFPALSFWNCSRAIIDPLLGRRTARVGLEPLLIEERPSILSSTSSPFDSVDSAKNSSYLHFT